MCSELKTDQKKAWLADLNDRQRNNVFPDNIRNLRGFWGGLYNQKLKTWQWGGLIFLLIFYVALFALLLLEAWPEGSASIWDKLSSFSTYLLFIIPLVVFFLLMRRRLK